MVVTLVAFWGLSHVEGGTSVLDGKTFIGPTGEKGKEAEGEDELRFENGMLVSVGQFYLRDDKCQTRQNSVERNG
jgi:hypothetical protein